MKMYYNKNEDNNLLAFLGQIVSRMPLDREETSLYEISVLACDQGARCGYTLVRVKVSDENDNSPRFLLPEYKTCIHSSLPVNVGFLTVFYNYNIG